MPPAEFTDETLVPVLWELLHNLALQGFYILHSDHLRDRELYQELWDRGLRDPPICPGEIPAEDGFTISWGSWGEEEMCYWLLYHASDNERARHLQGWAKGCAAA